MNQKGEFCDTREQKGGKFNRKNRKQLVLLTLAISGRRPRPRSATIWSLISCSKLLLLLPLSCSKLLLLLESCSKLLLLVSCSKLLCVVSISIVLYILGVVVVSCSKPVTLDTSSPLNRTRRRQGGRGAVLTPMPGIL